MSVLVDRERIFQPSRVRAIFLMMGGVALVLTELFRLRLRPLIRSLEITDFGFTDTIGNSGGIIVQIFLALAIINPTKIQSYRLAAFFSGGFILYEFAQPYLPKGTFDWYDVLATVVGYGIALILLGLVWINVEKTA
ncbi:MAG: hypothetical protein HN995_11995 [Candidatus Marinimicrobia bacterium]|jgi:hypothetical protein|nr:hypothetical protein [Candidatus Neomarinimicrobiota bacterium]MBT3576387.1 hypothetical protein [Candidatus Neomarinimicrobiota bacterium]MBT3680085.1 hypothetical protein [Candidatus Neomarinimicrobiota bacterium]MBT3950070.1 hypothetical protein [Candidatus Neomarinimicrobiota bacterium]MBT4254369.1 hypothetical protein [Candidatus Neomarinimicrobiota bacterium]